MPAPQFNPAYLSDPALYGDQQAIEQQRQLADLLMKSGLSDSPGTESIGGVAIRRSPLEGAAKLAKLLSGQQMQGQANIASQGLMQRQAAAMMGLFSGQQGQPQGNGGGMAGDPQGAGQAGQPMQGNQGIQGAPMPQSPPQGGQSGPLNIPGLSPQQNMLSYMTSPDDHMKALVSANSQSEAMKELRQANIDPNGPIGQAYLQQKLAKSNLMPLEEVKAGNTGLDPVTHLPKFYAPRLPEGAQPTFGGPNGNVSRVDMSPGGSDTIEQAAAATDRGKAQNDMTTVSLPNGQTQNMTRAQAVAYANGASSNPMNYKIKPGTEDQVRQQIIAAGDYSALGKFDKQVGDRVGMPGFTSGQSTSDKTGATDTAAAVVGRNQAIISDAGAAKQDINSLTEMGKLATGANFGPGASNVAKWKAMAAQVPGIGLIADPTSLEQQQTNVTLMKKYMSNMAGRMSGSSGTGTDARLQNAIDSLPNDAAPDAAIKMVVPMLIAQRTARLDEAGIRQSLGSDPAAISAFENKWRTAYDPLAYEATIATKGMTPQQAQNFVQKTYTPAQAAEIAQSRAKLRALGVQF